MSDNELFKAIKEYEEKNNLKEVREINKALRKIRDICRKHDSCGDCPLGNCSRYYKECIDKCFLRWGVPENWEIK